LSIPATRPHARPATIWPAAITIVVVTIQPTHRHLLILPRQVSLTPLIPTPKTIPVCFPLFPRQPRVPILIAIVHIPPAMIVKVPLRPDNPVPKSLPLNILQLLRRRVPATAILAVTLRA
jgi:hypothetical protein